MLGLAHFRVRTVLRVCLSAFYLLKISQFCQFCGRVSYHSDSFVQVQPEPALLRPQWRCMLSPSEENLLMGGSRTYRMLITALTRPCLSLMSVLRWVFLFSSLPQFSGKVVEPATAETSMFGSDANALFDVIEKNKKAAEAVAAAAALADGDGDEEGEGAEGGDASDAETSREAA